MFLNLLEAVKCQIVFHSRDTIENSVLVLAIDLALKGTLGHYIIRTIRMIFQ